MVRACRRVRSRRGMTLVEMMVVVVILLVVMSVVSVGVFSSFGSSKIDTEALQRMREAEFEQIQRLRRGAPTGTAAEGAVAPVLVSSDLDIALSAAPFFRWPSAHTALDVVFDGRFVIENPDPRASAVSLRFPLPPSASGIRGVRLEVERPGSAGAVPVDAVYEVGAVRFAVPLPPGEQLTVHIAYQAAGVDAFSYAIVDEAQRRPVDLRAELSLPEGFRADVPSDALRPTSASPDGLSWQLEDLVSPPPITVELPAGQTLLGQVALACRLAALGMFAFGGGLWYLNEGVRPGRLDDFRLDGLLLLALNYSSFFAIFAVLGPRWGLWGAAAAAAVSLPLLTLHVARLTDRPFALTRALPLAAATLAAILAFTFLDAWRSLVVLGSGVAATAWVTVTWRAWSSGRRAWASVHARQQIRSARLAELSRRRAGLREALDVRSGQVQAVRRRIDELPAGLGAERAEAVRTVERLERAMARAARLTAVPDDWDLLADEPHSERCAARQHEIEQALDGLAALGRSLQGAVEALHHAEGRAVEDLSGALGEMERAVDEISLCEVEAAAIAERAPTRLRREVDDALGQLASVREASSSLSERVARSEGGADLRVLAVTARQHARGAEAVRQRLERSIEQLREAIGRMDSPEDADEAVVIAAVHCPSCGAAHTSVSAYCSGCGERRPTEIACGACGRVHRLPRRLLRDGWEQERLHCGGCGVAIRGAAPSHAA